MRDLIRKGKGMRKLYNTYAGSFAPPTALTEVGDVWAETCKYTRKIPAQMQYYIPPFFS